MPDDYYELLGVSRNADETEMKRAYRQLARKLHPDSGHNDPEAEEKFKKVTLAYEVLSDPERRRRYDMFGPEGVRGSGATGGQSGDPFFGAGGVGDIFEAFFGGGSPFGSGSPFGGSQAKRGPQRGPDAEASLSVAFEEAVFGVTKDLTVKLPSTCTLCEGSGAKEGTSATTCSACQGTGEVRRVRQSILGQMVTSAPCGQCGGSGQVIPDPCPQCRGDGRITEVRNYSVEVPAGIDDGATLRLSGRGPAGPRGGPSGDLYVHLSVGKSDNFFREGYNLIHNLNIAVTQASLGSKVTVPTIDGEEVVEIPAGTQSGKVIKLRQRGVPHLGGRGRGDMLVNVVVETPVPRSKEEEELIRQLAEARGEEIDPPNESIRTRIRSAFR